MPYITPDRFRVMGFGLDLGDLEDADFAYITERASSLVNAYCNAPTLPVAHDFRGGSISDEQHRWRLPDPTVAAYIQDVGTRRVYPLHAPLRTITGFRVMFTQTYQITIDPANLYVNRMENWAEVISLAAVVTGIYPVGVNFGLYTPVAEVSYTYGWSFTATDETLQNDDGYTWRAANQFWSVTTPPVIKVNGVVTNAGFTVDAYEGRVVFDALQPADTVVSASYTYPLPPAIRDATAYIIAAALGERELYARGMAALGTVRLAELEVTRASMTRSAAAKQIMEAGVPLEAQSLLDPYVYLTAR